MPLTHAVPNPGGSTIPPHDGVSADRSGHRDGAPAGANAADHQGCLVRIRELREENELLRKSADEFAALAERLQRALARERAQGGRAGANGSASEPGTGNRLLTISMQIEAEFRAIPNLRLTRWQAARLWDLDQAECDAAIAALVRNRVLRETPGGFVKREK
jgi:hypothetical protein